MFVLSASESVGQAAMTIANLPSATPSRGLSAPDFAPLSVEREVFPDNCPAVRIPPQPLENQGAGVESLDFREY
jgi:hypothetical protein